MIMELTESNKVKTSYEIALERALRAPEIKDNHEHESSFESEYDNSFFVKDDHYKHIHEEAKKYPEVKEDQKDQQEYFESLTFPSTEVDYPEMPEPKMEDFEVKTHYTGPMFDYGGYAKMNRTMIFGLRARNALVKVETHESITNVNKKTEDTLRSYEKINLSTKYPKVYGMTVPDLLAHKGKKILYTMMETSNKVHKNYAERLNLADEVWTPTNWCKEVFKNSNVYPEIKVMPLGVDTQMYRPGLQPVNFGNKVREFRFLSVSGWSYRKGFDILIRAFLEEFSNKDDVSLIISTRFAGSVSQKHKERIISDFKYFRSSVNKQDGDLPHIMLHSDYTKEDMMPRIYNSAHCFVLVSRGEGWGLPYCEAASCGVPIIASDHGGQKDFLDNETAYLVPPSSYFISRVKDPAYKNMSWISSFYENQEFPDYEGDSFELLKHHLRSVYENYNEAQQKAKLLRQRIIDNFTWDHAVDKVYNRLKEICRDVE